MPDERLVDDPLRGRPRDVATRRSRSIARGDMETLRFENDSARRRARDEHDALGAMGKTPTRLREISYALSPMRTGVMYGLYKDWAYGMGKRFKENALDVGGFFLLPLAATVWYVEDDA